MFVGHTHVLQPTYYLCPHTSATAARSAAVHPAASCGVTASRTNDFWGLCTSRALASVRDSYMFSLGGNEG